MAALYDGRGSVAGLTGNTGGSMITYRYDAYGNTTKSNNTLNNPYQYNAEYTDSSTGLQYLRARYYDSSQGRFTAKDTLLGSIEKPITLNLYTYCGNNPLNITDPSGHGWWSNAVSSVKSAAKTAGRWVNNHVLKPIGSAVSNFVSLQVEYYNMEGALRLNPRAGQPGEPMYLPPVEMSDPFKPISDKILNNATGLHINKQIRRTYDQEIADIDEKINNASSPYERSKLIKLKGVLEQERKELCKEMNKQRVNIATGVFDYIGYVPYIGAPADAINAVLYASQKDWLSSGLCAVSAGVEFASAYAILKNIDVPKIRLENERIDFYLNKGKNYNNSRTTVLGLTGEYNTFAEHNNYSYFKMSDDMWAQLEKEAFHNYDEMWKVNQKFLDEEIRAGKEILITNNPYEKYLFEDGSKRFFQLELDYLEYKGYTFVSTDNNLWKAVKK